MNKTFFAVFAAAFAIRLAFVAAAGKGEGERVGDAADYHAYAVSLVEQGAYRNAEGDRASRMPGYPLLLAAQYAALGRSPLLTQAAQCLFGALTCVLIAALAARWSPPPWPLAAGLFAAVGVDLVEPCARLLTEAPAAFFLTLTLWLISDDRTLHARRAALAGASAAAAYLLRPELLPWAAIVAAHVGRRAGRLRGALLLAAPLAAALLWGTRNAIVLGRPMATTTAGAFNLYGWGLPRTLEERLGGPRWERAPDNATELSRSDFYAARLREFFMEKRHAWSTAKAAVLNIVILYYPFSPALDPTFLFLAPFALWGLWAVRGDKHRRLLWLTPLYFTAVYALAGVMIPRHRETYAGVLVLLSIAGLEHIRSKTAPRTFATVAGGWAAVCATAWAGGPWLRMMLLSLRDRIFS